jgi:PRTRC genetic system protein A
MPHFGELPELQPGERRYVAAADGLYLQARTRALQATVCVLRSASPEGRLPYGELQDSVTLPGGPIPLELVDAIEQRVVNDCPLEWACIIQWNADEQCYELHEPPILSRSGSGIEYDTCALDPSCWVLDLHSHGEYGSFFSHTDNRSDGQGGVYFASVLGHCQSASRLSAATRLVIDHLSFPLLWHPWEGGDALLRGPVEAWPEHFAGWSPIALAGLANWR